MTALDDVLAGRAPAYALLHRAGPDGRPGGVVDVLVGPVSEVDTLAEVPLPDADGGPGGPDVLVLVPYRQIAERRFACVDDGAPLLALTVADAETVPLAVLLDRLPDVPVTLSGAGFDVSDAAYADTVRRVVADEIGTGLGANFVLKRSYRADVRPWSPDAAAAVLGRLLRRETGAYWTFLVHTGDRTFLGATPERHVTLAGGVATMNPISGTYRYPAAGADLPGVLDFLADRKETDELYMVVDEELKMMSRICPDGGRLLGPYLREMARLAHTEYLIEGRSDRDPREVLRETMFAPTVTGSPLESACRVIARYEPEGRGWYAGVAALIGRDADGRRSLDSAILIRTAEVDGGGRLRLSVGATLVKDSDPDSEVAETAAKAAGVLAALEGGGRPRIATDPRVRAALAGRNTGIATFWRSGPSSGPDPVLAGRQLLVVDAEDTFTSMLARQLGALGLAVDVRRFDELYSLGRADLVLLGPGPGDPRDLADPRIAQLHAAVAELLGRRQPFLAVCLSHQVLSLALGLPVAPRPVPAQGVQREIDLFGTREWVGFYNSFAARAGADVLDRPGTGPVRVSRDPDTGEVHALSGAGFASVQFHAESVFTRGGPRILARLLRSAAETAAPAGVPAPAGRSAADAVAAREPA